MSNIFQQYLKAPKSVLDFQAEYDDADARKQTLKQNALALAAGQQKYDEGVQGSQRAAQLRNALTGLAAGATDDDRINVMRGTGTPEGFAAADGLEKSLTDRRKSTAAASKDEADASRTNLTRDIALHDFHAQKLAMVQTPADALAWAEQGAALGLFKQPGQYEKGVASIQQAAADPKSFADWKARAMQGGQSITEQLKQQAAAAKQAEEVRQFGVTEGRIKSENDKNRQQSDRHFNARESRERGDVGPAGAKGGKAPAGYRWTAAGDLEAIPGGPAGNKAASSEGERKAATLLQRLEFSEKQLESAVKRDGSAAKPGLMANGLRGLGMEAVANTITGGERQEVDAAQLDILDAALTLGTGAAYTRQQLEGYQKSYFAQIGDTAENVKAKDARLKNVIDAAKTQAGRSAPAPKPTTLQKVATPADYAKIPSGAEYITPDGQTRRKK